jgi:phospholipid/cholesterol/gamma-HCH transport system substrate-binding protein
MRRRLLGLAFVVVLAAAVGVAVLAYRKAFTPAVWVTLQADHTGMQLSEGADVKLRGAVVGDVRQITANGERAELRLALVPELAQQIPSNVAARLLPRTLFGEKYVELVPPASATPAEPNGQAQSASPTPIANGAVIALDQTQTAVELERVIDEALPLLQAIRPDALAATLGALAYALAGRGAQLGADLSTVDNLLTRLNQQMPAIAEDVRQLVDVVNTYDGAADDILAILRNVSVTANTITDQRAQLAGFLADTADLADTTRTFLERYGDRIIRLGEVSRPVLELLAVYSPEYPCLLQGVVALQPQAEGVFATGRMHITLEITKDRGKYVAGRDEPVYGAHDGPNCRGLPDPAVPGPEVRVNDGYAGGATPVSMGFAGTAEERAVIKPLLAAANEVQVDQVPDVAVLLWGPLLRGAVVSLG